MSDEPGKAMQTRALLQQMQQALSAAASISGLLASRLTAADQPQREAWEADIQCVIERLEHAPGSLEVLDSQARPAGDMDTSEANVTSDRIVRASKQR